MSSIFGFLNVEEQKVDETVQNMFEALSSRGGDSKAVHNDNNMVMGVRGEADYVKKALVMNPAKSIVVAIEGEIYNFEELKKVLGDNGSTFDQDNVFNIIIHLYEKFGKDFPRYLNGIFAIALWDDTRKVLYLARDHLGSHSLFYTKKNGSLFFATTLQSLLKTGYIDREISLSAMNTYFSATAICPPNTLLKNIFCLRPGSIVSYVNGDFSDYDYWPIKNIQEDYSRGMDDFVEEVRALILDAITIRANYGKETYSSLLSGGVDTGIISATLAGLNQQTGKKLPVFSIAFEEEFYSDAKLQQIMYERYALEPHITILTSQEFSDILQKAVAYLDTPVNDVALVGMYKAFEMAKHAGCLAVFDGEAADEIFYTGHAHAEREFQRYLVIPFWLRQVLFGKTIKTVPLGDSFWKKGLRFLYRLGLPDNERRLIGLPTFYRHSTPILLDYDAVQSEDPLYMGRKYLSETSVKDPLNIYYYGLLKTFLPDDLLFKNERMAAVHGVMNRTPFIDYRLVELAYKIPQKLKIKAPTETDDGTKLVYKKAIKGLIPDEILNRKKTRGFSQPSSVWYRNKLKDFVSDTLFSQESRCLNYVNKQYMQQLYSEHVSGKANFDYLLNSLLIFEFWLRAFLK
jgi:asparagine synthase (glutamine-hydrolysing)